MKSGAPTQQQVINPSQNLPTPSILTRHQGVYSGVVDFMSGGLKADTKVVNNQALRGFQISDKDGAVEFETIIPGHYQGRAHHIHVATHLNPSIQKNLTITSGPADQILHVGQLYLDQDLLTLVENHEPYKSNKAPLMLNKDDMLLMQGSGGGADPVIEYVLIGKEVGDGVFGWINFGVDKGARRRMGPATVCDENGCQSGTLDLMRKVEGVWEGFKGMFGLGSAPRRDPAAGGVVVGNVGAKSP